MTSTDKSMHANWFIYTMYFLTCLEFIDPSQLSIYSVIDREVNVTILELILYSKTAKLEPILMDWGYRTEAGHECLSVLH